MNEINDNNNLINFNDSSINKNIINTSLGIKSTKKDLSNEIL